MAAISVGIDAKPSAVTEVSVGDAVTAALSAGIEGELTECDIEERSGDLDQRDRLRASVDEQVTAPLSAGIEGELTECDIEERSGDPDQRDPVPASVDEQALSAPANCFNLATWVPSTPPTTPCLCDPYNVCKSTLLSESCGAYAPVGAPVTVQYYVSIICPDLQFGWQLVTKTTQTYAAFCTISYKCGGSTVVCTATGTKYIKRRKVKYGPPICPAPE